MALPEFSMRQLLEAGCHFGHQTHRWNPKMAPYIFGSRNNIHIMDLAQTVPMLQQALQVVSDTVAEGGRVLFVGTKRQASQIIAESATRSAQYYVNARWLGGMLTNWNTISNSIKRLRQVDEILSGDEAQHLTKKERLTLTRESNKLVRALGGIKDMGGTPDLLFVIDTNKEAIAVQEATKLGIPVVAVLDSNCDPAPVTYPIPGNDDAARAINLYCELIAKAAIDGIERQQGKMGVDVGESELPVETALDEAAAAAGETAAPAGETAAEPAEPAQEAPAAEKPAEPAGEAAEAKPEEAGDAKPKEAGDGEAEAAADKADEKPAEDKPAAEEVKDKPAEAAGDTAPADEGGPLFTAPDGDPDDLKQISGVGPVLEGKLHELGITQFAQIAKFKKKDIEMIDERLNFKGRIERDDWIAQAKKLMKGS